MRNFCITTIGSYHNLTPIPLSLKPVKRKKEFKFEISWLEDAECGQIIGKIWLTSYVNNEVLLTKLKRLSKELAELSKKKFSTA